jgi:hypothetical protein
MSRMAQLTRRGVLAGVGAAVLLAALSDTATIEHQGAFEPVNPAFHGMASLVVFGVEGGGTATVTALCLGPSATALRPAARLATARPGPPPVNQLPFRPLRRAAWLLTGELEATWLPVLSG